MKILNLIIFLMREIFIHDLIYLITCCYRLTEQQMQAGALSN